MAKQSKQSLRVSIHRFCFRYALQQRLGILFQYCKFIHQRGIKNNICFFLEWKNIFFFPAAHIVPQLQSHQRVMRTELRITHHPAQQTHIGSLDTVVIIQRHRRQGTDIDFQFIAGRNNGRDALIQAVDTFDDQHRIIAQSQLTAPVFAQSGTEIIFWYFNRFSCQQALQMVVE